MMPRQPLVRSGVRNQHDVVAIFQRVAEDLRVDELGRKAHQRAGLDALADALELRQIDALVRTDRLHAVRSDVEDALSPELNGFSLPIEDDGADGTRGRVKKIAKDCFEHYAAPRTCSSIWMSLRFT